MPANPDRWLAHFLTMPFIDETAKQWVTDRADLWGQPSSNNTIQLNTDLMWNLIPAMVTGFFDDGQSHRPASLASPLITAH